MAMAISPNRRSSPARWRFLVGARYNVTFQRIYLDEANKWQTSTSFGRDDLPLVLKLADQCHSWIFEQAREERPREEQEEEVPY
jgi:hypothetical protein